MAEDSPSSEEFSNAANSIIDSFSQLQNSLQENTEKLSQLQDDMGDTLFDSDFMRNLEDSLIKIATSSDDYLDNQNRFIGAIESLEGKLEELGNKIESGGVSSGGGAASIDYDQLQNAVSKGVHSAMEDGGFQASGGQQQEEVLGRIEGWLEILSGNVIGEERSGMTGQDIFEAVRGEPEQVIAEKFQEIVSESIKEGEVQNFKGGELSEAMSTGGNLRDQLVDMFENLDLGKMSSITSQLEVAPLSDIDDKKVIQDIDKQMRESSKDFDGSIGIEDLIKGNIQEGTKAYRTVLSKIYENFENVATQEGVEFQNKIRNILSTTKSQLEDLPTQVEKMFGMDVYFQELESQFEGVEKRIFEDILPQIEKKRGEFGGDKSVQGLKSELFGIFDSFMSKFQQLDERDMSQEQLFAELQRIEEEVLSESEEGREKYDLLDSNAENLVSSLKAAVRESEEIRRLSETIPKRFEKQIKHLKTMQSIWENLKDVAGDYFTLIKNILTSKKAMISFASAGVVSLASTIASQFFKVDNAMQSLAQETGLTRENLGEVRNQSMAIHGEMVATGASLKEVVGAAKVMRTELSGALVSTERMGYDTVRALQEGIVEVSQGFNVSNSEAAELLGTMSAITGQSGKQLEQGMRYVQELSKINDVAPQKVMKDLAQSSEKLAKFGELTRKEMADAAVQASKMGSNLNEVLGVAENFRNDITGSVQGLQRAELMLGQNIDTQGLVQASFQGPEQFTKRFKEEIQSLNLDLENLPTYKLQSLANSTGLSVQKLREMNEVSSSSTSNLKELQEGMGSVGSEIESSQSTFNKLKDVVSGIGTVLLNTLARPLFNMVNPAIQKFSKILDSALGSIDNWDEIGMVEVLDKVENSLKKTKEQLKGNKTMAAGFGLQLVEGIRWLTEVEWGKVGEKLSRLGSAVTNITNALSGDWGWKGWSAFAGTIIGGGILSYLSGGGAAAIAGFAGALWGLGDALGKFADAGKRGLVTMTGAISILSAFGAVITSLVAGTAGVGAGAALGAAGVVGAFAGSLWVLGDAMLKFGKASRSVEIGKLKKLMTTLKNMPSLAGSGFSNMLAGLVGEGAGDQLQVLSRLASKAEPLSMVAHSLERIVKSLKNLGKIETGGTLDKVREVGVDVARVNRRGSKTNFQTSSNVSTPQVDAGSSKNQVGSGRSETGTSQNNETESVMDVLKDIRNTENALLKSLRNGDIRVYMDGEDITDTVAKNSNRRNGTG